MTQNNPIKWEEMNVVLLDSENNSRDVFLKVTLTEMNNEEMVICLRSDVENINPNKPRVEVYLTYHNNFAGYSDFNNSNNAYELTFYAYRVDLLKNGKVFEQLSYDQYEMLSNIIYRAVENFIYNNKEQWLKVCKDAVMRQSQVRVSHVIWCDRPHKAINPPQYEFVIRKAKLPDIKRA